MTTRLHKLKWIVALMLCTSFAFSRCFAIDANRLTQIVQQTKPPFNYRLQLMVASAAQKDTGVMICLHGFGSNYQVINSLRTYPAISDHLVSFNFPDAGISSINYNPYTTTFGSIQELLPALYVIKQCVVEGNLDRVSLYGFSAGGGTLVNAIAVLTRRDFDEELLRIGITSEHKHRMLQAIQRGNVIFDCPLKSMEEILAYRGPDYPFQVLAQRYRENHLRPIDSLKHLKGLSLNAFIHFQVPDEALSNRDDHLFIQTLKEANHAGSTWVVIGKDGGHNSYHASLWQMFMQKKQ